MNNEEKQTIKKALTILDEHVNNIEILSELKKLFNFEVFMIHKPLDMTSDLYLSIKYRFNVVTVKIDQKQHDLFERWLHDE